MLFFIKNTFRTFIVIIKQNKLYFIFLCVVAILGIAFGYENVRQLKDDIDLTDITDTCFTNASKGKWPIYTFIINRFLLLVIPSVIAIICTHFAFIPLVLIICFANAYFFAFNFMILVYNLSTIGLIYVFFVCLPCYLIYLLIIIMLSLTAFYKLKITTKYNILCFKDSFKEISKKLIISYLIFSIAVIYESIFLFVIYNKYIFAMS